MSNDQAAFPQPIVRDELHGDALPTMQGLSKRELFAAMAMQGVTSAGRSWPSTWDAKTIAERAVALGDALLAELNKGGAL